eukprot:5616285-Prymnesium_polylepis.1
MQLVLDAKDTQQRRVHGQHTRRRMKGTRARAATVARQHTTSRSPNHDRFGNSPRRVRKIVRERAARPLILAVEPGLARRRVLLAGDVQHQPRALVQDGGETLKHVVIAADQVDVPGSVLKIDRIVCARVAVDRRLVRAAPALEQL